MSIRFLLTIVLSLSALPRLSADAQTQPANTVRTLLTSGRLASVVDTPLYFRLLRVRLPPLEQATYAGPNAVLALAREGYRWGAIRPRDVLDAATYPGLWRLGRRHWRYGLGEVRRSLSKRRFTASLARLVPALTMDDLQPAGAGVRAQAIRPDGGLVDDFLIVRRDRQVHVLNAPSPAATSSLEIARHIVATLRN